MIQSKFISLSLCLVVISTCTMLRDVFRLFVIWSCAPSLARYHCDIIILLGNECQYVGIYVRKTTLLWLQYDESIDDVTIVHSKKMEATQSYEKME